MNLSVIGLGLIGGSVALGARRHGLAGRIAAHDARPEALSAALGCGAVDRAAATPEEAASGADLVVLAVPVLELAPLALRLHAAAGPGTVITDVGSTKESIVSAMQALPPGGASFVGGHPIAGREDSGFAAARPDLFEGAPFIATPTPATSPQALAVVEGFWSGLGSRTWRLAPGEHDRLFAVISHLPHLLAYALVGAALEGIGDAQTVGRFAGGGFRDFTRIAASDPVMWRDIALDNRRHVLHALDLLEGEIGFIREALAAGDGEALSRIFERARAFKRST